VEVVQNIIVRVHSSEHSSLVEEPNHFGYETELRISLFIVLLNVETIKLGMNLL
jgi:hypothetical protein